LLGRQQTDENRIIGLEETTRRQTALAADAVAKAAEAAAAAAQVEQRLATRAPPEPPPRSAPSVQAPASPPPLTSLATLSPLLSEEKAEPAAPSQSVIPPKILAPKIDSAPEPPPIAAAPEVPPPPPARPPNHVSPDEFLQLWEKANLPPAAAKRFVRKLRAQPGRVAIHIRRGDETAREFARMLKAGFLAADWRVDGVKETKTRRTSTGLDLSSGTFPPPIEVTTIYSALTAAQIAFSTDLDPNQGSRPAVLFVGGIP
jgi:hypothetical protein